MKHKDCSALRIVNNWLRLVNYVKMYFRNIFLSLLSVTSALALAIERQSTHISNRTTTCGSAFFGGCCQGTLDEMGYNADCKNSCKWAFVRKLMKYRLQCFGCGNERWWKYIRPADEILVCHYTECNANFCRFVLCHMLQIRGDICRISGCWNPQHANDSRSTPYWERRLWSALQMEETSSRKQGLAKVRLARYENLQGKWTKNM